MRIGMGMRRSFSMSLRLLLVCAGIFLTIAVVVAIAVNTEMRHRALVEAHAKAHLVMNQNIAVHDYFKQQRHTILQTASVTPPVNHLPDTLMSTITATRVIDRHFQDVSDVQYDLRIAAINANNPANEADAEERAFLKAVNADRHLKSRNETRTINSQPYYTIMYQGDVLEQSCMRCHHSSASSAKVGQVMSVLTIRFPLNETFKAANLFTWRLLGMLLCILSLLFVVVQAVMHRLLIRPLTFVRQRAARLATTPELFGEALPVALPEELRELTSALDTISADLHAERIQMETHVADRTADLSAINAQLREEISERERIEQALRESEAQFHRAIMDSPLPIAIFTEDDEIVLINHAWTAITGYHHEDIPTVKDWVRLAYGEETSPRETATMPHLPTDAERLDLGEYPIYTATGEQRIWEFSLAALGKQSDGRQAFISVVKDVTERKHAEERLGFLALHDALTELPNRILFTDRLQQACLRAQRQQTRVAVVILDIDRFKEINDTLGHDMGDQVLIVIAENLRKVVRGNDSVCRISGDEFALILEDIQDGIQVEPVIERLLTCFATPMRIQENMMTITASVGISLYPTDATETALLVKYADLAMYAAKSRGRNTFQFFTQAIGRSYSERMELAHDLREALRRGELFLHYQPQIELATGRIISVEALVRWEHPARGLVSPAHFIPLAEETNLIGDIDNWVLEHACRQYIAWQQAGSALEYIAVNLSAYQFQRSDLPERVLDTLERVGMPPHALELEITEGIALRDIEHSAHVLRELRHHGIRVAIDDFGMGYSSFLYLKSLPFDTLKLDRAFIRDLPREPDLSIVRAMHEIGNALGVTLLAEAVEDSDQYTALQYLGCTLAQGYYLCRPLPADTITPLLASWSFPIEAHDYHI